MEILLGCGRSRDKRMSKDGSTEWTDLVTVDCTDAVSPDVVHDISVLPLPFDDNVAEEIHAYEVMEHVGQQGDWRFFFDQWSDLWRILKPGGLFFGTSPHWQSRWAWGDPGHTRIVSAQNLVFLDQTQYEKQCGVTPMTDYRFHYKADFDLVHSEVQGETYIYGLKAVKPTRCKL